MLNLFRQNFLSKINMSNRLLIALLALAYSLLFNSILIFDKISLLKYTNTFFGTFLSYLYSFISCYLLFTLLAFNRLSLQFFSIILFLISSLTVYFIYCYGIKIDNNMVALLFQTDAGEALNFLSLNLIAWVILCIMISYNINKHYSKPGYKHSVDNKLKFISVIFLTGVFALDGAVIHEQFLPFNILKHGTNFLIARDKTKINKYNFSNEKFIFDAQDNDLNIVVVVGESARSDHFHINGYNQPTTPNLEKITNLLSYNNVHSCANMTFISVPCMLTRATKQNLEPSFTETSFIEIFKKLGFNSMWLGNQGGYFSFEHNFINIAKEADQTIIPTRALYQGSQYDEDLFPYLDDFLNKNKKNNLIIIHSNGSHYHYESRYKQEFRKFNPICEKKFLSREVNHCDKENIINSYDNTILYTDYFLSKIIEKFKNKNTLFLYASDHGESLGENGVYLHGTKEVKEQYHIPMIIWASDKFKNKYPEKFKNLKEKVKNKLSHDNIFHTILDCANIESKIIDKNLSLCR